MTLQWLTASGSFGAFTLFDAALANPGAGSTAWSATVTLPAGTYGLDVRAVDTGGLVETSRPWVAFTVS